jgi:hypothetical protein
MSGVFVLNFSRPTFEEHVLWQETKENILFKEQTSAHVRHATAAVPESVKKEME